MKKCRDCDECKEDSAFYKKAINKDGLYSYCKKCTLKRDYYAKRDIVLKKREKYRKQNKNIISQREAIKRIRDVNRFSRDREKHLRWSSKNRERLNEYQREWYKKNKEKRRAHVLLHRAIQSGKIMRPGSCSECNKVCLPDGHHIDYTKPLDVIWICRACHSRKSPRTVIHVSS